MDSGYGNSHESTTKDTHKGGVSELCRWWQEQWDKTVQNDQEYPKGDFKTVRIV